MSAFIVTGTNEDDMSEIRIAQAIAISFGILWAVTIGLTVLSTP